MQHCLSFLVNESKIEDTLVNKKKEMPVTHGVNLHHAHEKLRRLKAEKEQNTAERW